MNTQPFSPTGDNVPIAASVASASGLLPGTNGDQARVYNATSSAAFIRFGAAGLVAVATDAFVAPGTTEVFSIPPGVTSFAVILSTGTGTVYAQRGFGS